MNSECGIIDRYVSLFFVILNERSDVKDLTVYCAVHSVVHPLYSWDVSVGRKRST